MRRVKKKDGIDDFIHPDLVGELGEPEVKLILNALVYYPWLSKGKPYTAEQPFCKSEYGQDVLIVKTPYVNNKNFIFVWGSF